MRYNLFRFALGAVLAGTLMSAAGNAWSQGVPEELRVDMNLKDADMLAATKVLTQQTGLQFVLEPGNEPYGKVTLSLSKVTAEEAIRYICTAAGVSFRKDENGVYIISHAKPATAGGVTPTPDASAPAPAVKKPTKLHKFKLRSSDAEAVYHQLVEGKNMDPMQPYLDMNRFVDVANHDLNAQVQGPKFINLAPNSVTPLNTQTFSSPRTSAESGNNVMLPGESAGQIQDPTQFNPGGFNPGFPQGNGFGQPGQNPQNRTGGTLPRGGLIPPGIEFLSFDPSDNSIVIRGTDEEIRELQDAISFFDVVPRQVTVKVEFVTTSSSEARALGVDLTYTRAGILAGTNPGTFAQTVDPIFATFSTGNIAARLRASLSQGRGRVVNAPILRTLNNQPAQVTEGTRTAYFTFNTVGIGNGNTITTPVTNFIDATTTLVIRPRINEDGTITMFLNPRITDLGQIRTGPNGVQVPDQLTQQIALVARVRNGDTIALAGLTRKSDLGTVNKFPILGDLPIIGQLFRLTRKSTDASELIVFVTPTVVEDEENTGLGP